MLVPGILASELIDPNTGQPVAGGVPADTGNILAYEDPSGNISEQLLTFGSGHYIKYVDPDFGDTLFNMDDTGYWGSMSKDSLNTVAVTTTLDPSYTPTYNEREVTDPFFWSSFDPSSTYADNKWNNEATTTGSTFYVATGDSDFNSGQWYVERPAFGIRLQIDNQRPPEAAVQDSTVELDITGIFGLTINPSQSLPLGVSTVEFIFDKPIYMNDVTINILMQATAHTEAYACNVENITILEETAVKGDTFHFAAGNYTGISKHWGIRAERPVNQGKAYFEFHIDKRGSSQARLGIASRQYVLSPESGYFEGGSVVLMGGGNYISRENQSVGELGSDGSIGGIPTSGVVQMAVDYDNNLVRFGKDDVWGSDIPLPDVPMRPFLAQTSGDMQVSIAGSLDTFIYSPPSGYTPWQQASFNPLGSEYIEAIYNLHDPSLGVTAEGTSYEKDSTSISIKTSPNPLDSANQPWIKVPANTGGAVTISGRAQTNWGIVNEIRSVVYLSSVLRGDNVYVPGDIITKFTVFPTGANNYTVSVPIPPSNEDRFITQILINHDDYDRQGLPAPDPVTTFMTIDSIR